MKTPFDTRSFQQFLWKHRWTVLIVQALIFAGVGYVAARNLGGSAPKAESAAQNGTAASAAGAETDGPSLWTCSMHPQIRQPNPGDCPICGMDLIPVTATAGGLRTLTLSPETRALMSIASKPVERRYVTHQIPMVGKVDYDETKLGYITAWVPGRLDRLYVDYTGVAVQKGDHMVYIYSPQLYSAQEELIQALKHRSERSASTNRLVQSIDLVEGAREKLRLLGLTKDQIKEIEQQNKPSDHLTIYSPVSGVVIEKLKQEGDYVSTGERVYTVADLNRVWVHLDAYETDLPWIRYGQDVVITTEAYPGEEFHGRIAFVQPVLNDKTRTVKVRVNVPNADGKLKPEMFVHAVVKPRVAAGGRVMDPSLAGKWISPMHPEIVKDEPGKCDICGMPLVRAETLGFVTPVTDEKQPPLVIPYSAALVTGRRAVIYVELPTMPSGIETAFQGVSAALEAEDLTQLKDVFAVFSNVLDRPYDQKGTRYARDLWNRYADQLARQVQQGKRVSSLKQARDVFAELQQIMDRVHEDFSPLGQPTFEGREIVLGPRAGNFYLVRHGLQEGELVVVQGNFKIDAEIQIQAKPSMMTPEGGGGGGHQHGTTGKADGEGGEHAGHVMSLPSDVRGQLRDLEADYQTASEAIDDQRLEAFSKAMAQFQKSLNAVNGEALTGHARMVWNEFSMLLGNDAVEAQDVADLSDAERVFLLLKGHMRRMREQLGLQMDAEPDIERIAVPEQFQKELASLWDRYLSIQRELAADEFDNAREMLPGFESALATINDASLSDRARQVWARERGNLEKLVTSLQEANDVTAMRNAFEPLSEEIGVLARTFGFGATETVWELHCPMAFQGKGAVWYQSNDQVRNPYYGASMLKCADRVEELVIEESRTPTGPEPIDETPQD